MKFDLYRILGVARDASAELIRKTFRQKIKAHHPDTGGDRGAFEQLKLAYDVLIDPERRAHYDQTGQANPMSRESQLREIALRILGQLIVETVVHPAGDDAVTEDLKGIFANSLTKKIAQLKEQRAAIEVGLTRLGNLAGLWSSEEEGDLMESVARAQRAELERGRVNVGGQIEAHEIALAILQKHNFKIQPKQQVYFDGRFYYQQGVSGSQ